MVPGQILSHFVNPVIGCDMTVNLYGICFLASLVISFIVVGMILARHKVPKMYILYSLLLSSVSILYFSKLYTSVVSGFEVNIINAGTSSLGGVIGLFISVWAIGLIVPDYRKDITHAYCLVIPLLYSVSKLGCHFAGCCHGISYDGPFAISYNNKVVVTGNVFPVQATESLVFMAIFVIGMLIYFKRKSPYAIQILILMCAAGKFLLAYLREEQVGVVLSPNQIVCIVFAISSIVVIINKRKKINA